MKLIEELQLFRFAEDLLASLVCRVVSNSISESDLTKSLSELQDSGAIVVGLSHRPRRLKTTPDKKPTYARYIPTVDKLIKALATSEWPGLRSPVDTLTLMLV